MSNCKVNTYLANLAVWMVKLHNLHWNVTGHVFKPLHEYTEALYDEAFEAYDAVAEVLKMRDRMPLSTMKAYLEVATIEEVDPRDFSCCEVVSMIEADMQTMMKLALEIRNEAAERDDFQVQGLFEGYIEGFTKQLWFIRAMKKEGSAQECCGGSCGCGGH